MPYKRNYSEKDWHTNTSIFKIYKVVKHICQKEKGKCGTPHIQGFIQFKNAINFNTLKKICPVIHWEVCKNIPASINYCSKTSTRYGKSYTFGVPQAENGKPVIKSIDDLDMKDDILAEMRKQMLKTWEDNIDILIKYVDLSVQGS